MADVLWVAVVDRAGEKEYDELHAMTTPCEQIVSCRQLLSCEQLLSCVIIADVTSLPGLAQVTSLAVKGMTLRSRLARVIGHVGWPKQSLPWSCLCHTGGLCHAGGTVHECASEAERP